MTVVSQKASTGTAPVPFLAKWGPLAVVLCGTFVWVLDGMLLS